MRQYGEKTAAGRFDGLPIAFQSKSSPGCQLGEPAVSDDGLTANQDTMHALAVLSRLVKARLRANFLGLENIDIRIHANTQNALILDAHALRRQGSDLADRLGQGNHPLLADIGLDQSGIGCIDPRVRHAAQRIGLSIIDFRSAAPGSAMYHALTFFQG